MALFTSSPNEKFEITAFSQTPSVISYGDTVTWSITIKNKCGYTINGLALEAYMGYKNSITDAQAQLDSVLADDYMRGYSVRFPFYGSGLNTASISWPNNTERTFTVSRAFDGGENYYTSSVPAIGTINLAEPDLTGRLLQNAPALTAYTNTIFVYYDYVSGKTQYNGNEEDFQGDITNGYSQNLIVFSHTWLPTASLSIQRGLANGTASDEGERLLLTAQIGKTQYADVSSMACRLYYASGAAPTTASSYVDLTSSISALLTGVTDDVSLVTQTFANGQDWYFLLWFGDAYESASASASVSRAFANLHLSGASTGGAAFGRFSSSTEGNPKLESEYPFFAYGGIEGVTNYSEGEVDTGGTWIDGKKIYRRVVSVGTIAAGGNQGYSLGLALSDISSIIRIIGGCKRSNGTFAPLPNPTVGSTSVISVYVAGATSGGTTGTAHVYVGPGSASGVAGGAVAVEYTKA